MSVGEPGTRTGERTAGLGRVRVTTGLVGREWLVESGWSRGWVAGLVERACLGDVPALSMFPLGSVLFPHMPLRLRVFEERYLVMLSELVKAEDTRFGVVLIERGFEVGGGEHRFGVGTTADVAQIGAEEGVVGLVAQGTERFEVDSWLDDAPYPRAEVRPLPALEWDASLEPLRRETEQLVRRTLALASEFAENVWPADVELADEPVPALWQLAAIAPVTPLDQVRLLRATSAEALLTTLAEVTRDAAIAWETPWPETPQE